MCLPVGHLVSSPIVLHMVWLRRARHVKKSTPQAMTYRDVASTLTRPKPGLVVGKTIIEFSCLVQSAQA